MIIDDLYLNCSNEKPFDITNATDAEKAFISGLKGGKDYAWNQAKLHDLDVLSQIFTGSSYRDRSTEEKMAAFMAIYRVASLQKNKDAPCWSYYIDGFLQGAAFALADAAMPPQLDA